MAQRKKKVTRTRNTRSTSRRNRRSTDQAVEVRVGRPERPEADYEIVERADQPANAGFAGALAHPAGNSAVERAFDEEATLERAFDEEARLERAFANTEAYRREESRREQTDALDRRIVRENLVAVREEAHSAQRSSRDAWKHTRNAESNYSQAVSERDAARELNKKLVADLENAQSALDVAERVISKHKLVAKLKRRRRK